MKTANIGLQGISLFPITSDSASSYATGAAIPIPEATKLTITDKSNDQTIYADDKEYKTFSIKTGDDIEITVLELSFATQQALGMGTYDESTGIFTKKLQMPQRNYALAFTPNTVDLLPLAVRYRKFTLKSVSNDGYTTNADNVTVTNISLKGTAAALTYPADYALYCQTKDDSSNSAAYTQTLTQPETLS
jgi:hypothetical protein